MFIQIVSLLITMLFRFSMLNGIISIEVPLDTPMASQILVTPLIQRNENPPNGTCTKECKRKACLTLIALSTLGIIVGPTLGALFSNKQLHPSIACASDNELIENLCFSIKIEDCGSCNGTLLSDTYCAQSNFTLAGDITSQLAKELNSTCGPKAYYCVRNMLCNSGGSQCDSDNFSGFIKSVQDQCAKKDKKLKTAKKPKMLKPMHFFQRKNMAWDKRRKP